MTVGTASSATRLTLFVAGATGVIGRRLVPPLVARGHRVIGMTRDAAKVDRLLAMGALPVVGSVFDTPWLIRAMRATRPDAVIHQLTDLPANLDADRMDAGLRRNARMRDAGTRSLVEAARAADARRIVAQSIAWAYAPSDAWLTEDSPLDVHADGLRAVTIAGVRALEAAVLDPASSWEGTVLRFGRLFGPGTGRDGADGLDLPLHVDDAVSATVLAVEGRHPGAFNVVGPNPSVSTERARRVLGWQGR